MTAPDAPVSPLRAVLLAGLRCVLLAVPLWLGLLHLPVPASIEIFDARPMALDYSVRHGIGLGVALPSDAGPLGALLTGVHSGQPLWLNFWCQSLVGLTFALGLSWTIWRTAAPLRWWLLGALLLIAGFRAEYLHLAVMLLAGLLLTSRPVGWLEAAGIGLVLGLLALINVQFALLGLAALLLSRANLPSGAVTWTAALTAGVVMLAGWFWAGQPAGDLLPWLANGLTLSPLRHQAAAWPRPAFLFGLAAVTAIVTMLAGTVRASQSRGRTIASAAFVLALLVLAWRQATGQPDAGPQPFFVAVLMAALAWQAGEFSPAPRIWLRWPALGAMAAAVLGLLAVEPRILTESIIRLNQKIVANVVSLTNRRAWQRSLNDSFRASANLFALPRIKAATAGQRTDLLGNAVGYALVNQLEFAPRPGLQSFRVGDPGLAARDAAYYSGPATPQFVVQRLQAFDRGLPALEDAPAQLALYAGYDFQFEENGFVLWQRRPGPAAPVAPGAPVWRTQAAWDQTVVLPVQPGRAYWLVVKATRSAAGWLKSRLLAPADPTLLLRDGQGDALSYRASPETLAIGFLLTPLFRGEIDLVRYQAREPLAPIREVALQKPADAAADFTGPVELILHEVAAPAVSGRRESAEAFVERFRIANRLPVAVAAYYPPQATRIDGQEVLLAHPDSSLEFPLRAGDRRLQGRFGLLEGTYRNGGDTDGVEFVVEHVPIQGPPAVLWRRHLDPVRQTGDRGLQSFAVDLPQPASGRVILRTQNLPGHNAAWDWSLWTDLRFAPSPATK